MPLFAGPDEPAHTIKAAGTVRGDLTGDRIDGEPEWRRSMQVPAILDSADTVLCWAFVSGADATCAAYEGRTDVNAAVATSASRHPPLYYAIVGMLTWFGASHFWIRLMRIASVLLAALFVGGAARSLGSGASRIRSLGLVFALTPAVVAWQALINPSVLEISSSLCLVAAMLALGRNDADLDPSERDRLLRRAGVSAIALALARALGPLWLVIIGLAMVLRFGWLPFRRLLTETTARLWLGAVVVAGLIQTVWVLSVGTLSDIDEGFEPLSLADAFRGAVGMGNRNLTHIIGVFGWNNPRLPYFVEVSWLMLFGALLFAAAALADRRGLRALAFAVAAMVAIPIAIETYQAWQYGGFPWQARYTVPIAILVPLIATDALAERTSRTPGLVIPARAFALVGAVVWLGHALSYWAAIRRFSVGTGGSWVWMFESNGWKPPLLPAWTWFGLFLMALTWYVRVFVGSASTRNSLPG